MSLGDFIQKSSEQYTGPESISPIVIDFVESVIATLPFLGKYGRNIYDYDWDVLLILDACRWDMYQDVVGSGESVWTSGSSSHEFMENNFNQKYAEEMSKTAYVTGNPFSERMLDENNFGALDEMWKTNWNKERGTILPEPITDRTIQRRREGYRVIGHYMQPHYPFLESDDKTKMEWGEIGEESESGLSLWDQFRYRHRDDLDRVKGDYWRNLEIVWEEVQKVLNNADGKVVVTADHGNALGEWGFWGHKPGFPHPKMRRVPWDIYQAVDSGSYSTGIDEEMTEVEDRLEQLGYK